MDGRRAQRGLNCHQNTNLSDQISEHLASWANKIDWNRILKRPRFVLFCANITHFRYKSDHGEMYEGGWQGTDQLDLGSEMFIQRYLPSFVDIFTLGEPTSSWLQGCHISTQVGPDWYQMEQIWNFLRSVFSIFGSADKIYDFNRTGNILTTDLQKSQICVQLVVIWPDFCPDITHLDGWVYYLQLRSCVTLKL